MYQALSLGSGTTAVNKMNKVPDLIQLIFQWQECYIIAKQRTRPELSEAVRTERRVPKQGLFTPTPVSLPHNLKQVKPGLRDPL